MRAPEDRPVGHKSLQPISKEPDRKGLHIPGAILDPKVFLF